MKRIESPLRRDRVGYCFRFKTDPDALLFGPDAAQVILIALRQMGFTGRCEYYDADDHRTYDYRVGLGLKKTEGQETPNLEWWQEFAAIVTKECDGRPITVCPLSELVHMVGIRAQLLEAGIAEFKDGEPVRLIDDDEETDPSWFQREILDMK